MVAPLQSKGSQDKAEEASTGSTQLDVSGSTGGLDSTGGGTGGRAAGAAGTLVGYGGMGVSERFSNHVYWAYVQLELDEPVSVDELPVAVAPDEAELVAWATAPVAGKKCEL